MYNAANRLSTIALASFLSVSALTSCGDSSRDQAAQLSAQAEKEINNGNYQSALTLLDTLDSHYAKQVEVRRSAMKFRAMAVEGLTIANIAACDDSLASIKARLDNEGKRFEYIKNPGKNLGGNYIDRSISKAKSDILPRINDDGYFTLSVIVPGRSIGLRSLRFCAPGSDFTTSPISSDRVVRVENSEMTVLQQEDVASAIEWLTTHKDTNTIEMIGNKSTIKQKLSDKMYDAIIATYRYALDKQAYNLALIEREKLERRLQLCRNQLANAIDK